MLQIGFPLAITAQTVLCFPYLLFQVTIVETGRCRNRAFSCCLGMTVFVCWLVLVFQCVSHSKVLNFEPLEPLAKLSFHAIFVFERMASLDSASVLAQLPSWMEDYVEFFLF